MKQTILSLLAVLCAALSFAQTAKIQIIHNSPQPSVDVYINGDKALDNFAFRNATPYLEVPAGVELNIGVALSDSESADDALVNIPVTLMDGSTYIAVANGIVGGNPAFGLEVFDMGREVAADSENIDILFFHGAPDAPEVDITLTDGTVLFDDIAYGNFSSDYLSVPFANYDIAVTPANDNSTVVAAYAANLAFWKGNSAVVFASGFLSGNNPDFQPWVALSNGGTFPLNAIPSVDENVAKVQIIHNSPSPTVDIYANDGLLLDDFAYRTATPFVEVPAGTPITLGVALDNSTSAADAIATFEVEFEAGKRYIAVANGVVGGEPGFDIDIFDAGQERALNPGRFDLLALHGSPDAPAVDIEARGVGALVTDLAFGEFAGYLQLPLDDYTLDIKAAGTDVVAATIEADITGLAGQSGVAIASGFLANDPAFAVLLVLADGTVVELPQAAEAYLQVIHNSPTPTVDIYVNGALFLDDFVFRTATPYVGVPAGVELTVGVAPATSTSADDVIANFPVTLENGKNYVAIANGIVGGTPGFNIEISDMGREYATDPNNVDLLFFHGAPDAPEVDITLLDGTVLFDDVAFGQFSDDYLSVPFDNYDVAVTPANDNSTVVAAYQANFRFWRGQSAVIFASGFLSGDNPAFKAYVALSNGGTFPLLAAEGNMPMNVYPSVTNTQTQVEFELSETTRVEIALYDANGTAVRNISAGTLGAETHVYDLDVTGLIAGTYYVQIRAGKHLTTKQIIVSQR